MVHQGQAVGKLVRIIRDLRPQVLITFGPDGIYGHYDHIATHRWATIAADLAADTDCFPDQTGGSCRPHRISKLYYRALPEVQVDRMAEQGTAAVMMDGVPFRFVGLPEDAITTVIDISAHARVKLRGILCHATQTGGNDRLTESPEEVIADDFFRYEHFVLARSEVGRPIGVERDLFWGLG